MKCCQLSAGKLRNTIIFETPTLTPDGYSGSSVDWSNFAVIRSMIKPVTGSERWQSQRLETNITHRIFIRYRAGLNTEMRINYNGRLMQIEAILNIEERNKWFEIHATEGEAT